MLVSYAQNFEDIMLWRALKSVSPGLYIDVGAQDPKIDSVSQLFYEKGWRGVHVEATSAYATKLRDARPDETVIQAAVSDQVGILTFYEIPETGISTGDPIIAQSHRDRGFNIVENSVPTISLHDVFELVSGREIHWLKIDVEGMEREVLSGWGSKKVKPWIVVVESILPFSQLENFENWENILFDRDYVLVHFDGINRYYISPEHLDLRAHFVRGVNVFDEFSLSGLASAPFCAFIHEEYSKALLDKTDEISLLREQERISGQEKIKLEEMYVTRQQESVRRIDSLQLELGRAFSDQISRANFFADEFTAAFQINAAERAALLAAYTNSEKFLRSQIEELQQKLRSAEAEYKRENVSSLARLEAATHLNADRAVKILNLERELALALAQEHEVKSLILIEQDAKLNIEMLLAEAQKELFIIKRSRSWRLTSILRYLTSKFHLTRSPLSSPILTSSTFNAGDVPQSNGSVVDESANLREVHMEHLSKTHIRLKFVANSLSSICSFHDKDFIRSAYLTILDREPDPDGLNHYLGLLRSGRPKIDILMAIRVSQEGRITASSVPWLDIAIKYRRREKDILTGWFFTWRNAENGSSFFQCKLRAIEDHILYMSDQSSRRLTAIEDTIARLENGSLRQEEVMRELLVQGQGRVTTASRDLGLKNHSPLSDSGTPRVQNYSDRLRSAINKKLV